MPFDEMWNLWGDILSENVSKKFSQIICFADRIREKIHYSLQNILIAGSADA